MATHPAHPRILAAGTVNVPKLKGLRGETAQEKARNYPTVWRCDRKGAHDDANPEESPAGAVEGSTKTKGAGGHQAGSGCIPHQGTHGRTGPTIFLLPAWILTDATTCRIRIDATGIGHAVLTTQYDLCYYEVFHVQKWKGRLSQPRGQNFVLDTRWKWGGVTGNCRLLLFPMYRTRFSL